LPKTKQFKRKN